MIDEENTRTLFEVDIDRELLRRFMMSSSHLTLSEYVEQCMRKRLEDE